MHSLGLAIQWGPIGGNSLNASQRAEAVFVGAQPQRIKSLLEVMERFLNQSHPVVSSFVKAEADTSSENKPENNHLVDSVTRILGEILASLLDLNAHMKTK
ncbi:hypothetical protein HPB51_020252 [Rhipicephalus microplus]|uniref:Uncharacterized protein n=1 Tax=Rhipicephalus microplus TaxID=6941 RepID=A0A9J6EU11_RHIMP|nr:hypothetical protein HPB51_020252 [Rhipicephalus microplus]